MTLLSFIRVRSGQISIYFFGVAYLLKEYQISPLLYQVWGSQVKSRSCTEIRVLWQFYLSWTVHSSVLGEFGWLGTHGSCIFAWDLWCHWRSLSPFPRHRRGAGKRKKEINRRAIPLTLKGLNESSWSRYMLQVPLSVRKVSQVQVDSKRKEME